MGIVSSQITVTNVQGDGRIYYVETHTDNVGLRHIFNCSAYPGANLTQLMLDRVPILEEQLATNEMDQNLSEVLG